VESSAHRSLGRGAALLLVLTALGRPAAAQSFPTNDSVIRRIWHEGMQASHAASLAQVLADSIGPRLTGSPANRAAVDWLLRTYKGWGIAAEREPYGTWRSWARGVSGVELLTPRVRVLEATMLAWSATTPAGGVQAEVVTLPPTHGVGDAAAVGRWLTTIRGKVVMLTAPEPTCRPDSSWLGWAGPAATAAMRAARDSGRVEWDRRIALVRAASGTAASSLADRLAAAGAVGFLTGAWSGGWGVDKIKAATTQSAPIWDLSCEDYGLLARLAAHGQHPTVRAVAEAKVAPAEVPVDNTIAELRGGKKSDEYVMLSAHLDSWDAGSGATDNGTGTIVALEAMRILSRAYPHPRRTILAGHWNGEEEGDLGAAAYVATHADVVRGLQVLFNQDNGTGPIDSIDTNGFLDAPGAFARWMARMPKELTAGILIAEPGFASDEDSDSDAFACKGAPGFFLTSADYHYIDYTWHTNRDTYDKIDTTALKRNATLIAMLAYEASEDPTRLGRARRVPPIDSVTKRTIDPPACAPVARSWAEAARRWW